MVAVPGVSPANSVAVAVPLSSTVVVSYLFLLLEKTARVVVNVTGVPIATGVPFLSFSVALITDELIPSAINDEFETVRVMFAVGPGTGVPAVNFTTVLTTSPPAEHCTLASPSTAPAYKTAIAVPKLSVTV